MILGIDCDGVLADFNSAFIDRVIAVTGRDLFPPRPFDIPTWNYPEWYSYTRQEVSDVWEDIKRDPLFWATLPVYPDTTQALRRLETLAYNGADVYFITARPGVRAKAQTEEWLQASGYSHQLPTVLVASEKGLCATALGLDVYLDDRWENAVDVAYTPTRTFLLNRPWNMHPVEYADEFEIQRVDNVLAFLDAIQ